MSVIADWVFLIRGVELSWNFSVGPGMCGSSVAETPTIESAMYIHQTAHHKIRQFLRYIRGQCRGSIRCRSNKALGSKDNSFAPIKHLFYYTERNEMTSRQGVNQDLRTKLFSGIEILNYWILFIHRSPISDASC